MIKVIHTEWSDGWGGQEIRIISEMTALRDCGVEVYLACRENSHIRLEADKNHIKTFTLPFKGNFDFRTIFALVRIIKEFNINVLNSHSGKDTWVGGIAAKIAGIKFIRTRHLSNPINNSRLNFINELADFIITTGESVRQQMIINNRIVPEKIQSIPTGPDEENFNPKFYNQYICRKKFGIEESDYVIGMLAVLRKFKRHDRFLLMAKNMLEFFPNIPLKFFIAGEGPQRKKLESLIAEYELNENVFLLGHINNQAEFLSSIDLFILASDSGEGVPQSLMQALMMNKLAIATDVGSVRDLYCNGNFLLIDKDSQEELNECTKGLISNYINTGENIYKEPRGYIVDNFSRKVMTKKIFAIYNKFYNK